MSAENAPVPQHGTLYYGDNLEVLRQHIKDETVDLVYLDPPFNSNATYNVLFAEKDGTEAAAQIKAFDDTWRWDTAAAQALDDAMSQGGKLAATMQAFAGMLGQSNMMAYLAMMAPRLAELKRVLKPTGSIYLHCDPTASHYLKLLMDAIFGAQNYRNEIVWKRADAHNDARRQYPKITDRILFYSMTEKCTFGAPFAEFPEKTLRNWYLYLELPDGAVRRMTPEERETQLIPNGARRFNPGDLRSPHPRPNLTYDYKGFKPHANGWAVSREKMEELERKGLLVFPKSPDGRIMRKRYLDEQPGVRAGDCWTDISQLRASMAELLGYPTQKPVALLERIIQASSNEGDVVLDPFCGCGTAVVAAQKLKRRWIGIDITHLAVTLIKTRLRDTFGDAVKFDVVGEPITVYDAEELAKTDPYQFQWWALGLVGARPVEKKKGADQGIDGRLFFRTDTSSKFSQIIFSVKAGHVMASHVRDLRGVIEKEKAEIGVLISFERPTHPMRAEAASAGFYESPWGKHPRIQLLTVEELLSGKKVDYPQTRFANVTFKTAPAATQADPHEQAGLGLEEE